MSPFLSKTRTKARCLPRPLIALVGLVLLYLIPYLYLFNARINFDGIVVDEQGQPVPGALITYRINRATPIPIPFVDFPFVNSTGTKTSGKDGAFHFRWRRGQVLSIQSVTVPGYRDSLEDPRSFYYSGYPGDPYRPIPDQPVDFLLVHADKPRVQRVRTPANLGFRWNDGVQEIPLGSGIGPLLITPTRTQTPGMGNRIPWEMELTLTGAQLSPSSNLDPLATLQGYQASLKITPAEKEEMRRSGAVHYDFRTASGLYGRIRFHVYPGRDDMSHHNASLQIILAPEGSRGVGLTFSPRGGLRE